MDYAENMHGNIDLTFQVEGEIKKTQADLIVGADGIRSVVRRHMVTDDTPLSYVGCIVILGICPLEKVDEHSLLD